MTSNGLVGGKRCESSIEGLPQLFSAYVRTTDEALNIQTFAATKKAITITIPILPKTVGENLVEFFEDSMFNASTFTVTATDARTPDFSMEFEYLNMNYGKDASLNSWDNVTIVLATAPTT